MKLFLWWVGLPVRACLAVLAFTLIGVITCDVREAKGGLLDIWVKYPKERQS